MHHHRQSKAQNRAKIDVGTDRRDRDKARRRTGGRRRAKPTGIGGRWADYERRHGVRTHPRQNDTMIDGLSDGTYHDADGESDEAKRDGMDDISLMTLSEGGKYLGITGAALKRVILKLDLPPDGTRVGDYGNVVSLYSTETLDGVAETDAFAKALESRMDDMRRRQIVQTHADEWMKSERERVAKGVIVNVRRRTNIPSVAHVFVGPTNSGKSHNAIERLVRDYEQDPDGIYVYAGPLRMLAYEVYERLRDRIGTGDVGFVTGEEQVNADAHIRCCTVEMAPMRGTSLVLDEAHWIVDQDRGQYWTNLLVGGEYDRLYVITAQEAEDTVGRLLADAVSRDSTHFERLTPIEYGGTLKMADIAPRTAVIAFSRRGVYDLARRIGRDTGLRCGVLYGALPLDVRKGQIDRYMDGAYDVMVTTDVIGHGINLPIDNVVFSQTDKFDGTMHRDLRLWEAAQIAGRAGRYGMTGLGRVYALDDDDDGRRRHNGCDARLVSDAVLAARGDMRTDLSITDALVTPRLSDLGVTESVDLMLALGAWSDKAREGLSARGITSAPMRERRRLLAAIADFSGAPLYPWSRSVADWTLMPSLAWTLSGAPLDPDGDALYHIVCWACDGDPSASEWLEGFFHTLETRTDVAMGMPSPEDSAYDLERVHSSLSQLRMVHLACGTLGTLGIGDVERLDSVVSESIGMMVQAIGTSRQPNGNRHFFRHRRGVLPA